MSGVLKLSGWQYRAVILSIVISALGYLGFSLWGGWQAVSNAVGMVGVLGTGIALLMSLLNYGLRFLRWQVYLRMMGHSIPWKSSLKIYLAGFALTTTPGKAGEAMRGVLLKPWGVPYAKSFAAFFSERLSDLFGVLLLTLFGLTLYPDAKAIVILGAALVAIGFLILSQRSLVERVIEFVAKYPGKISDIVRQLSKILLEAQCCHGLKVLGLATSLSVTAWTAEALAFYWILGWMGADVPFAFAVFVYAVSMLAGALSFMPGGLGGAEAVMVSLLVWKGMPSADAVAATVVIRLATLWFAVALGAALIYKPVDSIKETG